MVKVIRILFFIGSLRAGGKERRLIELLSYLQGLGNVKMMVVCTDGAVHYPGFFKLNVSHVVVKKRWSQYDPSVFYKLYRIISEFKPDYVHTWGRKQTFYALPAALLNGIPLINSQITSAPPRINKLSVNYLLDRINFRFSDVILANSKAGINAYGPPPHKSKVIYNGLNMNRFDGLPSKDATKAKYKITTPYAVVMVASVSPNKDYDLYFEVAQHITAQRRDISFIGVGWYDAESPAYKKIRALTEKNPRLLFPGMVDDVEALVKACDIGVLFSNQTVHGEGISNAIMEYMALGKPVIATDAGGTREIVADNVNGYIIADRSLERASGLVLKLINNPDMCASFGRESRQIIEDRFLIEKMGKAFQKIYMSSIGAEEALQVDNPIAVEG